ncbi:Y-family DNA polymerase [Herbaspirillum sp. ST 5-3]|uniref:Y-family DNA polymerase n=1 Tax=Oxalobacteraceae TaxID=75682 RepID=UPI0010A4BD50|nr:Y-family DNA polymerase [Herbaspirillum sp. ST 5-3]
MFALIDGNNFYVSCERVFQPQLIGRPVISLSNNDGCTISRSNEAKNLGIKMGQPWFEIRHLEKEAGLVALSSNFTLYGDMSNRMMQIAAELGPAQEIYSIDESFIGLHGVPGDLVQRCHEIRSRILKWVGIPCGVGIGATKTRAKLANHIAKTAERKPGIYPAQLAQVCNLEALPASDVDVILAATDVGEVWGVGRQIGKQLKALGVHSVLDLAHLSPTMVKKRWNVVLERTVRELQGEPCIALDDAPPPKQQIACTRSFGQPISTLPPLVQAVSDFASRAAEKLREQDSVAGQLLVFAHTSPFRGGPQFSRHSVVKLLRPTSDSRLLVKAAIDGITSIYSRGFQLIKAGIILLDIMPTTVRQCELDFGDIDSSSTANLMATLDALNHRFGRGAVSIASAGLPRSQRVWTMKQERLSPHYTTRWSDLPIVKAN